MSTESSIPAYLRTCFLNSYVEYHIISLIKYHKAFMQAEDKCGPLNFSVLLRWEGSFLKSIYIMLAFFGKKAPPIKYIEKIKNQKEMESK